jgi:hypothetical protein
MEDQEGRAAQALVFERLLGARRVRLAGGWCGYEFEGVEYACFVGHGRFGEEAAWSAHYNGPDFAADLAWCHRAEAVADEHGLSGDFLSALLRRVYPRWEDASSDAEVLDFWWALAHASAADRAAALATVARQAGGAG